METDLAHHPVVIPPVTPQGPLTKLDAHWSWRTLPSSNPDGSATAPFMNAYVGFGGSTKHVAGWAHAGRLWFIGGDYGGMPHNGSYRQEIWSHKVGAIGEAAAGDWKLECRYDSPQPRPTNPDTVGWFFHTPSRRWLIVPGVIIGSGSQDVWVWNGGESYTRLTNGFGGTAMILGGVWDEVTDKYLVFAPSGKLGHCTWEYDPATFARSAKQTAWPDGRASLGYGLYEQSGPCQVGRYVYLFSYLSDNSGTKNSFMRWHIDNRTMQDLELPAFVSGLALQGGGCQPQAVGTKIVYPENFEFPGGRVAAVHTYNTLTGHWTKDTNLPPDLTGDVHCALGDGGRTWMCGSAGGDLGQTKEYIYTA